MSSAIPGSLEEFSGAVFRLFSLICGPNAPRNGLPGGERGFLCPVTSISGKQAGCEAARLWRPRRVRAYLRNSCVAERVNTSPDDESASLPYFGLPEIRTIGL